MSEQHPYYCSDADGNAYEYRFVSSVLERRSLSSRYWTRVPGAVFETMTPSELRLVADCIERSAPKAAKP